MTTATRLHRLHLRHLRTVGPAIAGAVGLAAVLAVLPWLLLTVVHFSPIPHGLPTWGELRFRYGADPAEAVRPLVCGLAWACWALLAARVLATAAWYATHARQIWRHHGLPAPVLPRGGWAGLLFSGIIAGWLVTARTASAAAPAPPRTVTAPTAPPSGVPAAPPAPARATLPVTYTVRPGDTLWSIAAHLLGDGSRATELYHLNAGRPQPDGGTLADPNLIQPGWILHLPTTTPLGPRPRTAPASAKQRPEARPQVAGTHSAAARPPSAHAATDRPTAAPGTPQPGRGRAGIDLGEAGYVGITLAAGIAVALVYARTVHRIRHRSTTEPASAQSSTVSRLNRAHLRGLAADQLESLDQAGAIGDPETTPAEDEAPAAPRPLPTGTVALGEREDREVAWQPVPGQPLILSGPGAPDSARALLLACLADAERARPEDTGVPRAVLTAATAQHLLPGFEQQSTPPTLVISPTPAEALHAITASHLTRQRQADQDLDEHVDGDLPQRPLLLVSASEPLPGEIAAIRSPVVLLDADGTTPGAYHVTADGTARPTDPTSASRATLRLFHLPAPTTEELLHLLADGYADTAQQPATPATESAHQHARALQASDDGPVVHLRLFGAYEVTVDGAPIAIGWRRAARELLAYLALQPDGATREEITCALWPEERPRHLGSLFHTALANARARLRDATATGTETDFILHTDGRYRLDPRLIETDIAHVQAALHAATQARQSDDPHAELDALRKLAKLAPGGLLKGFAYEWQNAVWVPMQRDIIDAFQRASELEENAPEKIAHLEAALSCDPYDEALYEHLAGLQAEQGRPEAAARTRALAQARLSELGPDA